MERAKRSDREAFAAALTADGFTFKAEHVDEVSVSDPAHGPVPNIYLRRERTGLLPATIGILVTIDAEQFDWLAVSIQIAYSASQPDAPNVRFTPVFKSSAGEFFVETHVGRLVAAGEFTRYFWTVAGSYLELDE